MDVIEPSPEIILFGDDPGTAEAAVEFGIRHFPDIARNEFGTPFLDDIFKKAHDITSNSILCYINADIILMSDFLPAVEAVAGRFRKFLMVGHRWDMDINEQIIFSANWENKLKKLIEQKGTLHPITGIDYFVFRRGIFKKIRI